MILFPGSRQGSAQERDYRLGDREQRDSQGTLGETLSERDKRVCEGRERESRDLRGAFGKLEHS